LAAHDAGGAEVLSSWASANPENSFRFRLEGPAVAVFGRKFGPVGNLDQAGLEMELDRDPPEMLITGTSWQSEMEGEARESARRRGIRTAAYLDHWVNYRERFGYPGPWIEKLPDEIWCPDQESLEICLAEGFPPSRLQVKGNPYLDEMVAGMADEGSPAQNGSVLYVCEPIRDHMEKAHGNPMHLGYDEFTALRHFFRAVSGWPTPPTRIVIRPHPSEPPGKYDAFIREFGLLPVERSRGSSLGSEINEAEIVVGCESMALVVALKMGKKVFTSVPPEGRSCRLPFRAIGRIDGPNPIAFVKSI
jgi:hypothetical protein